MKKIAIFGATGSVGTQTVDVARYLKDDINVVCISADKNYMKAAEIANEFKPGCIVMGSSSAAGKLRENLNYTADVYDGFDKACEAIKNSGCDFVVLATAGIEGIVVFEYCLKNNISVGLANKETVVCGGEYTKKLMADSSAKVYPIDSEHSAIYQCLKNSYNTEGVSRLLLTASGGPFFGKDREFLESVTPQMALKHPNWSMGKKITIDSATLANKGQEVIEAKYLFNVPVDKVKVIVHPQSIVHSMAEYIDGSIIAQMGPIDMRLPIQRVLTEDEPFKNGLWQPLDLTKIRTLEFFEPDMDTFKCLKLAYMAAEAGGVNTAVYSIADEIAVEEFLNGNIAFTEIEDIIEKALNDFSYLDYKSAADILHINVMVRKKLLKKYSGQ